MPAVTDARKVCIHCGTSFRATSHRPDFCCAGCQFVHGLIAQNGLVQFYDLTEGGVQPVKSLVFQKRDFSWLVDLAVEAERSTTATLRLELQGVSCIGCVWLIERLFARKNGALSIRVDPTLGQMELQWLPGAFDVVTFAKELQSFGYLSGPPGEPAARTDGSLIIRLGICGALAMNTMLFTLPHYLGMDAAAEFAPLFSRLTLILGTLSFIIGGSYFFGRSARSLRARVLHIDLPISIGLVAAWLGSVYAWAQGARSFVYFDFVSTFTFLMLVGRWLQQEAIERNRAQLLAAQADLPPVCLAGGKKTLVSALARGDVFLLEPGHVVPVRSHLHSDGATFGMEWISGESEAATARGGSLVAAGAVNCGRSAIELEALETWSDSLLAKLLHIRPAGATRDAVLERFIRSYIWIVVTVAVAGFLAWWITTGALLPALQVVISVLVVSCPCASGIALPLCSDLAASRLRRLGVFIRNVDLWAKLGRVRRIVFDKTGTLTLESISLRNPEVLRTLDDDARSVLLAMVRESLHPVSGCLREQLLADRVAPVVAGPIEETVGFGVTLELGGCVWRLGRPEWLSAAAGVNGECVFTRDGAAIAAFYFGEEARVDAREEIAALRARGCAVHILSGDRQAKVAAMADCLALPIELCEAEMSPQGKADWLRKIDDRDTLYIGDGANDSLAFDVASCSGTPAIDRGLLEQKADFFFLGRGLSGVRALLDIARRRRRTAHAVVVFAIAYNAVAVALSLAGFMSPLAAAILMPASSLVSLAMVFAGLRSNRARGLARME